MWCSLTRVGAMCSMGPRLTGTGTTCGRDSRECKTSTMFSAGLLVQVRDAAWILDHCGVGRGYSAAQISEYLEWVLHMAYVPDPIQEAGLVRVNSDLQSAPGSR